MPFIKTATIQLVALAQGSYGSDGELVFKKSAGKRQASVYQDGGSKIDIAAMLKLVAKEYEISDNPSDYIFEAARAVTAEVANENGDAFPHDELLRFDHRLGKAVYQTFILKPHHINHRADNPKTARGVVLDASYNDLSEPLPECPGCGHKTASKEGRDSTGVNCVKCGHVVKDEFVELLLAIDTKKDPTFAGGVKKGSLDSLSMGCEAGYTDCSICANRARNVAQFCSHIKSGNKKKIFKTASGPKMSFEKCGEVVFTEISRVDQPADPTAKQREVFTMNISPSPSELASRAASIYSKLANGAHLAQEDSKSLEDMLPQVEEIKTTHPELYNELKKLLMPGDADVPEHNTIDDYAKKLDDNVDKNVTPAEMGIKLEEGGLPVTLANKVASSLTNELDNLLKTDKVFKESKVTTPALKFASAYNYVEALVTDKGNVRVFTPKGTLFVISPENKPTDIEAAKKVATEVLTSIAEDGLVATASKYNAVMGNKVAQVLQHHIEDFAGGREDGDKGPITDDAMGDIPREKPKKNLQDGAELDHTEGHATPKKDVLKDVEYDHKETPKGKPDSVVEANDLSVTDKERSKMPKSTLDTAGVDRKDLKPKKAQMEQQPPANAPADGGMPQVAVGEMCAAHGKQECDECKTAAPQFEDADLPDVLRKKPSRPSDDALVDPMNFDQDEMSLDEDIEHLLTPGMKYSPEMQEFFNKMKMRSRKAAKQYVSRAERIYKSKIQKASKDAADKVAAAEKTAAEKVKARLLRALKLAAKRQALNLEESPLKARMFDVLASEMDIDADSFYPGMDAGVAAHIIEATVANGAFDEFVEHLVKRASEFMGMNEEAFSAIEADVKNLRTAAVVADSPVKKVAAREDVRRAAVDGNLVVAPSSADAGVSNGDARNNIRSALGTTKVRRNSQALNKK